jgi:hypothetical protein
MRTLTALLILNKLEQAVTFAERDVTPERLGNFNVTRTDYMFWVEMLEPLAQMGRGDLVQAIEGRLKTMRGANATGWWRALRDFDRKYLHGALTRTKQTLDGTAAVARRIPTPPAPREL